mgnify:CR=1 FL=1
MLKKIILLIGIVIILSNLINARGSGAACPQLSESYFEYTTYVLYSNFTKYGFFRLDECYGDPLKPCYGIIQIHSLLQDKLIFINSTNQEEMNIIYMKYFIQQCTPYNFGKVTYHKKTISGTHWY